MLLIVQKSAAEAGEVGVFWGGGGVEVSLLGRRIRGRREGEG